MNIPRLNVVAIVAGLSALGGLIAGGAAALIAAAVLTSSEPVGVATIATMALSYGLVSGLGGTALGTLIAFGALRRVALGRLVLFTNVGLAAGLTAGWIAGPWAWHHMSLLGFAGFAVGAVLARATSGGESTRNVVETEAALVAPRRAALTAPSVDLATPASKRAAPDRA